jgi:hypothetical protein
MADFAKLSGLQAATDQSRVDFLRTDLGLCFTFADLAKTEREIGDRAAAQRVLEKAETGYATIARMLAHVENADQKHEIEQKLTELRTRLDGEQHCLNASPA